MSSSISVNPADISRIQRVFTNLGNGLPEAIQSVFRESGDFAVQRMQEDAPKDTGYLADHIELTKATPEELEIVSSAEYSGYQEYGTQFQSGTEFFRPAVEQLSREIPDKLKQKVNELIS